MRLGPVSTGSGPSEGRQAMQFLLLTYFDEADMAQLDDAALQAQFSAYKAYTKTLIDAGVFQSGNMLAPTTRARSVRVRGEKPIATDGPFAETKEQLGGYYLIDCASLAEAERWAAALPAAAVGTVEVRPIADY